MDAVGLAARGGRGPVFSGVDLDVPAGGLGVVHGPGGSGRSTLLLALGGRFRLVAGRLRVGGHDAEDGLAGLRERSAVARIRPGIEPDEGLRVRDVVRQHVLASGGAVRDADVVAARELVGVDAPAGVVLGDLPPVESLLLVLALAVAERRPLILVDDVDHGLVPAERARAWEALDAVAASGPTVVASALETPAAVEHVAVALAHPGSRRAVGSHDDGDGAAAAQPTAADDHPAAAPHAVDDPAAADHPAADDHPADDAEPRG